MLTGRPLASFWRRRGRSPLASQPSTVEHQRLRATRLTSERAVPARFVGPLLRFTEIEAAGGAVLLVAALVAMACANAPLGETYTQFWETHLDLTLGPLHSSETLNDLVNDALMAVFFFVVGLEIKRELVVGELDDARRAALPAVAALSGMIAPALTYLAFASGGEAARGWGIPMATDIALSVGVISLLGTRVSVGAKLFLLALAIADDIGAIAVIAVFCTTNLAMGWLVAAIVGLGLVFVARRVNVRSIPFSVVLGSLVWLFVFESGVHATLAGWRSA
jgi:Na+:H+ antiporter, NhaA family